MKPFLFIIAVLIAGVPTVVFAQPAEARLVDIDYRVRKLEGRTTAIASAAFIGAILSALWAQNSGRNSWLWFFAGLVFTPITLLVLLYKNANDLERGRR